AATTDAPRSRAPVTARWKAPPQAPDPPRLMLITWAGWVLVGTPRTRPPEAQVMASAMSEVKPPHLPSTRTGRILALRAMPATPTPLSDSAAMVPATCVPCQLDVSGVVLPHSPALNQSPSSLGLASRPSPSRAVAAARVE